MTPWTIACQAPLSMGFPRQEHWSGFKFPSPGDIPDPGIKAASPVLLADSLPLSLQGFPGMYIHICSYVYVYITRIYQITKADRNFSN